MQGKPVRKVLIITYYWPPCGGVSVLFGLKLVKYLRDFGWEPIVYTVENPDYPFTDIDHLKELPRDLTVLKTRIMEPGKTFKFFSGRKKSDSIQNISQDDSSKKSWKDELGKWIRGNLFIPDARMLWIRPSVRFLKKYLKTNPVDAILTNAPPHSASVIGMKLSRKTKIPLLAHFRDPWTQVDYYRKMKIGKLADKRHRALERKLFETAKAITIASPGWKEDLEKIGAQNVDVIYTGYDEADFAEFKRSPTTHFRIFHAGLLGDDRNLTSFFEVIRSIREQHPEIGEKLRIILAGEVGRLNQEAIENNDLLPITSLLGNISRKEVFGQYKTADLLLLPVNRADNAKGRIPAKLFESLRTGIPILAFGPQDSDVAHILADKKAGKIFEYGLYGSDLTHYLLSVFEHKNIPATREIEEFSNKALVGKVAKILFEITGG